MKYLVLILCFVLGQAQAKAPSPANIPLQNFFEHARVENMKLSPDGQHIAFTYEEGTEVRLGIIETASMKPKRTFNFGENMHVLNFYWGNNERVLMEVGKVTGNLDNTGRPQTLYASNIDGSRMKTIFQMDVAGYEVLSSLKDDDRNILIARYHGADRGKAKAFKLDIYTGKLDYTGEQPAGDVGALIADNSGKVRVGFEFIEGDTFDEHSFAVHVKNDNKWEKLNIKSVRKMPSVNALGFNADNSKAYFLSNHDMAAGDTVGVFEYDFATRAVQLAARHSEADISNAIYGHDGDILGVFVTPGKTEALLFESSSPDAAIIQSLNNTFKGEVVSFTSYSKDGSLATVYVSSDRNPGEFYLLDTKTRKIRQLISRQPEIKPEQMAPMEPVTFKARDGLKIHAYLTRPVNADKNLPLIVNVHGGPFGVADTWGFDREAQFFASRGYATLQINYRGSGNYGQEFQNAGRKKWGLEMQDDITDGTLWAIKQGIADPQRICIFGGSYGGYATLAGIIKEPDLFKCAVGYVGVYDLPLFRSGDGSDGDRYGGDNLDKWKSAWIGDDKEALKKVSPVHNVDKIKTPLLLVHGEKDVRVPMVHFERLREALDEAGKPYEWLTKKEGHGFYRVENRVEVYTKMLKFFNKHIGDSSNSGSVEVMEE